MASYWQRDAEWADRWATTSVPARVDFCVIGGGFAGLMTAIRLRERNLSSRICVLEAERVGYGASGRSAGFLSPLAAPVWLLGAERSQEQAWGAAHINHEVHAIARWIELHVPACELAPATLALQAQSRASESALREFVRAVEHVGLDHELRDSRVFPGCTVLEMPAYTVHPYKLARGLAEHAERSGVLVRERARVRRVQGMRSGGATVEIDDVGTIEAGKVVVCTNAYTSSIAMDDTIRALVVHSFMAATEPAPPELVRDGDFTVEVNKAQAYHRVHHGRVIYGGIDKLRAPAGGDFAVPASERTKLGAHMGASFPGAHLEIAQAWSGAFQTTPTGLPIIRTSETDFALVFNIAYGGTGVALSLACAKLAACVASNGRWDNVDDTRLLALIHSTRISVRDAARTIARIAKGAAMPWLGA